MGISVRLQLLNLGRLRGDVEPAARAFFERRDPTALIALLRRAAATHERRPDANRPYGGIDPSDIAEMVDILEGRRGYSTQGGGTVERLPAAPADLDVLVREQVVPMLVQSLCLEYVDDLNPDQDMTHTSLVWYLHSKSEWIEGVVTFRIGITGGTFSPSPGESSQMFSREEVDRFSNELDAVPPPADHALQTEFRNLRNIVSRAKADPALALLLTIF